MVIVMGICPNCGSWVDEGDICGCCGGSGSYEPDDEEEESDESEISQRNSKRDSYSRKAWELYMDFKDEEALRYINMALNLDGGHSNNWNVKAIILESLKRYRESEECYDRSLELRPHDEVYDNKSRMLYDWASRLVEESKELPNGMAKLEKARETNLRAMNARPGEKSKESLDKYLRQRDSIEFYIRYEGDFQRKLEELKTYSKDDLFTITGRDHYEANAALTPGKPLKLVKEPDNKFDRDAIAVYCEDEKIGYVANSDYAKFELTSSASELQDRFDDSAEGCYLFYLDRYAAVQFSIGRIIG